MNEERARLKGAESMRPVAEQLTEQFAACISQKLAATPSENAQEAGQPPTSSERPKPLGLRLLLGAVWRSIARGRAS